VSNAPGWIIINDGSTGSGAGAVSYSVSANPNASLRTGTMTIAGYSFTVTQAGEGCSYSILPESAYFEAAGGTGTVNVNAPAGCEWTAVSNAPGWIIINDGSTGSGAGAVSYSVSANPNASLRTGTMTIAGDAFTVTQAGATASLEVTPSNQNAPAGSGITTFGIDNVGEGMMSWNAEVISGGSWLTITSGSSGVNAGTIECSYAANPGDQRVGTIRVTAPGADGSPQDVTVTQSSVGISLYYVPDDFSTIQEALDGVVDGDTIIVRGGTYTGANNKNLDFRGKAIILRAENGPENCIIDCESDGRGFYFHSGETSASVVDGFTIKNGWITGDCGSGGGILCENNSSPEIINCILRHNLTCGNGGGIACQNSSPIIKSCVITDNISNSAGAGIFCVDSTAVIDRCVIGPNWADVGGGGIHVENSTISITNCVLTGNEGRYDGGGVHCRASSNVTIVNCTFTGNMSSGGGYGGGIVCHASSATINNSIMVADWAGIDGSEIALKANSMLTVTYSNVQGGDQEAYVEEGSVLTWGTGNIDANPLFVSDADYHLTANSPCVDAATDAGVYTDVDGDVRPQHAGFDMGADEYSGPICGYSIEPTSKSFNWEGGVGSITVTASDGCEWTAIGNDWTTITSGQMGSGNGTVGYLVSANPTTAPRTGTITVAGLTFTITQTGLPHAVSLELVPDSTSIYRGGKLGYTVTATNLTNSTQTFQYWTTATTPNGKFYPSTGALYGPVNVTLTGKQSKSQHLNQTIPWTAPVGIYTYNAYIGTYPATIMNEDHFSFTVR
jgi:hypothetical protein